METFFPFVQNLAVFVGLLALLALANQQLFQKFVADLLVDPLVAVILGRANIAPTDVKSRLVILAATVKRLQPVLVVGCALLLAYGLNQPLTSVLATFVPGSLLSDPTTVPLINAILIGVTSFKAHDLYEKEQARKKVDDQVSASQKALSEATIANMRGEIEAMRTRFG